MYKSLELCSLKIYSENYAFINSCDEKIEILDMLEITQEKFFFQIIILVQQKIY